MEILEINEPSGTNHAGERYQGHGVFELPENCGDKHSGNEEKSNHD
jgi:hypothetical protein